MKEFLKEFLKEFGRSLLWIGIFLLFVIIMVATVIGIQYVAGYSQVWGAVACVLATSIYLAIIGALNKIHRF